jgi:hypothetical protein
MCGLGLACRHGSLATSKIVVSISRGSRTGIEPSRTAKRPYEKKPRTIYSVSSALSTEDYVFQLDDRGNVTVVFTTVRTAADPINCMCLINLWGRSVTGQGSPRLKSMIGFRNAVDVDASLRVTPCTALPNNRDL